MIVSFPDPTLKEEKGLVYIERFLGLDDVSFLNTRAPIRFTACGTCISVIIMWHWAIAILYHMRVRAVDALPCQNDVLSCQSHDILHAVAQDIALHRPDPFPPWGSDLGMILDQWWCVCVCVGWGKGLVIPVYDCVNLTNKRGAKLVCIIEQSKRNRSQRTPNSPHSNLLDTVASFEVDYYGTQWKLRWLDHNCIVMLHVHVWWQQRAII